MTHLAKQLIGTGRRDDRNDAEELARALNDRARASLGLGPRVRGTLRGDRRGARGAPVESST